MRAGHAGQAAPLGATVTPAGVNFSVFSKHATGLELLLFDRDDDARPARVIPIDPATNRQYHYWHIFVPGLRPGQIYGFRASGSVRPGERSSVRSATRSCSIRTGARSSCPKGYDRDAAARKGRQRRDGHEERRRRSGRLRLGRRSSSQHPFVADGRVRDARARIHATSSSGVSQRRPAARTPG